jgi:ferrous iron transport protein A
MYPSNLPACPLDRVSSRESGCIVSLNGGRGFVSRLAALGFVPGAHISMVQNYGRGPLIVLIQQARVALGRGEAARIIVRRDGLA